MTLYRSILMLGISTSKKFPDGLGGIAGMPMDTCTGAEMSDFLTLRVDRVDAILPNSLGGLESFGLDGAGPVCERIIAGLLPAGFLSVFRLPKSLAWLFVGWPSNSALLAPGS